MPDIQNLPEIFFVIKSITEYVSLKPKLCNRSVNWLLHEKYKTMHVVQRTSLLDGARLQWGRRDALPVSGSYKNKFS